MQFTAAVVLFVVYNNFSAHMRVWIYTLPDIVKARHHSYMSPRYLPRSHTFTPLLHNLEECKCAIRGVRNLNSCTTGTSCIREIIYYLTKLNGLLLY